MRSLLLLAALAPITACRGTAHATLPVPENPLFSDSFDDASGAFAKTWTVGQVTGVSEEAYTVGVREGDRGGELVVRQVAAGGAYQTAWRRLPLPPRDGIGIARLHVRLTHDASAFAPMVWLRLDGPEGVLAMLDERAPCAGPDVTEMREIAVAVPPAATALVVGLGLIGPGEARFDDVVTEFAVAEELPPPSPSASAYLEGALDILRERALYRDAIDWERVLGEARLLAGGAQTPADTYLALRHAVASLGDGHSHFLSPAVRTQSAAAPRSLPSGRRIVGPSGSPVGYANLPGHAAGSPEADRAYAGALGEVLTTCADARGFVLDLRGDDGGMMWPMLAGLGPLLGAERVGSFEHAGEGSMAWTWRDHAIGYSGIAFEAPDATRALAFPADLPIAVLIGPRTASSGEAVLVAFLGRPNVRTFGAPTAGLSTVNVSIELEDGALLLLTTGVYADRTGKRYGGPIAPDVAVAAGGSDGTDEVLEAGLAWLGQR